jgi:hypothetical protein
MGLLIRVESNDGHTVDVHGGDGFLKWEPKGVIEFRDGILADKPLTMFIHDAETSVSGPVTNLSGERDVEFAWPPSFPIKVFALVPGGWLPAAVCESTLLLPDANLAGSFSLLDDEASRLRAMSGLADVPLLSMGTNLVSAAFAAFEAGQGRLPTHSEFADRIKNIALRLQRGFPDRRVVFPNQAVIAAGFAALQDDVPLYKSNATYLAHAYPLISSRVEDAFLLRRHAQLDALAARFEMAKTSFVYFLTVDCLYDEGPRPKRERRPGRLVLKPKKLFKDADVFNALTDVMHMERLCKIHLVKEGERPVLCTMDHGLVQAWAMLGPYNIRRESGNLVVSLRMDHSFAPRLQPPAREAFFEQLRV